MSSPFHHPEFNFNNIKKDLKEIACEDMGWFHLAQDRVQW
jgi:hypothetical protein